MKILACLSMFISIQAVYAEGWPPSLDTVNPAKRSVNGQTIERYVHGPNITWGYPANAVWEYPNVEETGAAQQNHNSFYVVFPEKPRKNAPLYVVLHSANRTAYDYLGYACLNRKIDQGDRPETVMTKPPDDFYALFLSSTNAEWWGWGQLNKNPENKVNRPSPAELRVLETIGWVVEKYGIDRNRIYLSGVSMGGCGTLGIGMSNGDIFAAIRTIVPAGTNYASFRMGGFAPMPAYNASQSERDAWIKRASCHGLPDPPVIVDFSSQSDGWSMTQPALVHAAQAGRLPLVLCWGPFGHTTFAAPMNAYPLCEVALAFPWLEIRRNEAYPVFTNASSDQHSPWLNAPADFDSSGQTNAYFRWKVRQDTPDTFQMQLWIEHPLINNPLTMPETATADITLRRLQQFKIESGQHYRWQISLKGKQIASGKIMPDDSSLPTIPQVVMTVEPVELSIKRIK